MCCEWKDIETAPKDGTYILAFEPGDDRSGKPHIAIVQWHLPTWLYYEPDEMDSDLYRKVIKPIGSGFWEGGPWSPWRATHWMPLPEPPGAKEGMPLAMIDAGLAVLIDSGRLVEGELLSDRLLVQQLYRAMSLAKLAKAVKERVQ